MELQDFYPIDLQEQNIDSSLQYINVPVDTWLYAVPRIVKWKLMNIEGHNFTQQVAV